MNVALDLLFVLVLHWGIPGAAIATLIAQACSVVFCLMRIRRLPVLKLKKGDFYLWDEEQALLDRLYKDFSKVIVVINSCGPVSTREYAKAGAVLYPLYGGGNGV